jgi:RNA polymerase sigma-70 factor (ECF subfamily)
MDVGAQAPLDSERMAAWVRDHTPALRGFLLALVRRRDEADDLVQEVFARAWQHRAKYEERGQARAWLLRIADHVACDRLRRRRPQLGLGEEEGQEGPADHREVEPAAALAASEAAARLHAALDRLSPAQQRVLLLRYYGQLSFSEIAESLGCPLNTALSHCQRGLKMLRKDLEAGQRETGHE